MPFYIGKGSYDRIKTTNGRSKWWKATVEKYGIDRDILAFFEKEDDAMEHERVMIQYYRWLGYKLCNMSDGGEGTSGCKFSEEQCRQRSLRLMGHPVSDNVRKAVSAAQKGRKRTKEHVDAIRKAITGPGNSKYIGEIIATRLVDGFEVLIPVMNTAYEQGFNPYCVGDCLRGKQKTHKGYTFKLKEGTYEKQ